MADGKRENSHSLGNRPFCNAIFVLFFPESDFSSSILFPIILTCPNTEDLSAHIKLRICLPVRDVPSLGKWLRTFGRIAAP